MEFTTKICLALLIFHNVTGCAKAPAPVATDAAINKYAPAATATVLESGMLRAQEGFEGDVIGARVDAANISADGMFHTIDVSVPIDPEQVDSVKVVSESGSIISQNRNAEIVRDYENNKVGLRLFLSPQSNFGFKLRLIDFPDDQ